MSSASIARAGTMCNRTSKTSWSKSLPLDPWPTADRAAWQAALRPGDAFDVGGVASGWAQATQNKTMLGWGRFLFFLSERNELDPLATPAERITMERVR